MPHQELLARPRLSMIAHAYVALSHVFRRTLGSAFLGFSLCPKASTKHLFFIFAKFLVMAGSCGAVTELPVAAYLGSRALHQACQHPAPAWIWILLIAIDLGHVWLLTAMHRVCP